jgi:hypothetical protein
MALQAIWSRLEGELDLLRDHLRDFAAAKSSLNSSANFSLAEECLLEGLISRVWQSWGSFCRACLIESCMGTTTGGGVAVAALANAVSEAHVSAAAIKAKANAHGPYWGSTNSILRVEPTWGDVDVLVKITTRLGPFNSGQLLAALSSGHSKAKAIQTIRNGAAHNHPQNMAEINALRSGYVVFPITHPTQALFWIEPTSSDFLVTDAIQELKDTAIAAIA